MIHTRNEMRDASGELFRERMRRNLVAAGTGNYSEISGWDKLDDRKAGCDIYETTNGRVVEYENIEIPLPEPGIIHHVSRARVVGEDGVDKEAYLYTASAEVDPTLIKRKLNKSLDIRLKRPLTRLEEYFRLLAASQR